MHLKIQAPAFQEFREQVGSSRFLAVKNAIKRALPFTLTELRVGRYRMLTAREKLVSSDADSSLVVSELLRSISKPQASKPRTK